MKNMIYAGAMILAMTATSANPAAAQVGTAPWCAVMNMGAGSV